MQLMGLAQSLLCTGQGFRQWECCELSRVPSELKSCPNTSQCIDSTEVATVRWVWLGSDNDLSLEEEEIWVRTLGRQTSTSQREGPSKKQQPITSITWKYFDFRSPASRIRENKFLLLKPPSYRTPGNETEGGLEFGFLVKWRNSKGMKAFIFWNTDRLAQGSIPKKTLHSFCLSALIKYICIVTMAASLFSAPGLFWPCLVPTWTCFLQELY